tara:strand:- start:270 stop:1040 length:771 start_codon:yes stop_codon:yes gene_type:complete
MTKLSSGDLKDYVFKAGIQYLPALKTFYKNFLYKVELRPKHTGKGIGGVSGKRSCIIDIANPEKARTELLAFNNRMELIISNVEYRQEICDFVARLPSVEYKTRMGGNNHLFYFNDPEHVKVLVDRYKEVVSSVTGPINTGHEECINKNNILPREKLYYGRFRYCLEIESSKEFAINVGAELTAVLDSMPPGTWRAHQLKRTMAYYTQTTRWPASRPSTSVIIYISDPEDFVYIKLVTAEYVKSNHELVLVDELTG